jgi:mono/diheme cytochrome c family protein
MNHNTNKKSGLPFFCLCIIGAISFISGCLERTSSPPEANIYTRLTVSPEVASIKTGDSILFTASAQFDYERIKFDKISKDETLIWQVFGAGKIIPISNTQVLYCAPQSIHFDSIETFIQVFPKIDTRVTRTIRVVVHTDQPHPAEDTGICFQRDILPIFHSNCAVADCHNAQTHKEGYVLDSYSNIIKKGIVPGHPSKSKIVKVITKQGSNNGDDDNRMPPPPRNRLSQEQIDLIIRWIAEGAQDKDCSSPMPGTKGCDTTSITYSKTIVPIFQYNCYGCHSTIQPQGNLDLTQYANVKMKVDDGKLLGSITHSIGFVPMPSKDIMLNNCYITQIRKWIESGAPNN